VNSLPQPLASGQDDEAVLSQVVEFAPYGVAVTTVDGRVVRANAELARMFGYTRTQLLESRFERLLPARFHAGHAQLRASDNGDLRSRAMGTGRELVGRRADDSEFPIEIGLSSLESRHGVMVVETVVDISVRKRLERMFQRMVEAAPYGMVMIDANGRIVLVNPHVELMFGYARTELIGSPLEMLLPERFRANHPALRQGFHARPSLRQMGAARDLTARRKDGTEFPVEIGLNPVVTEEGGLVLAVVTDITPRKAMQLQLQQANANLEEFTYAASHELRSPLQGLSSLVEWIRADLAGAGPPEVTRNLARMEQRVQRLGHVINDLLAYGRDGTSSGEVVLVEPGALIESVLEMNPPPSGFRVSVQVRARAFMTARTPLETVLRNLIINASAHHDRDAGTVLVRAEDIDSYCVFTVSDDGPGIPSASQSRVFRIFQTLSPANRASSGVGLALSKRLVELHGGRIELESRDGVRGTSFSAWWPRFQWSKSDG